jgi:hypothetical protein
MPAFKPGPQKKYVIDTNLPNVKLIYYWLLRPMPGPGDNGDVQNNLLNINVEYKGSKELYLSDDRDVIINFRWKGHPTKSFVMEKKKVSGNSSHSVTAYSYWTGCPMELRSVNPQIILDEVDIDFTGLNPVESDGRRRA